MKTRNLIILTIISLAVFKPLNAQVKYYKVQNGTKTLLKEGEKITIPLNEKMESDVNFLMEVDIVAFKKAYTYQQIASTMVYNSHGKVYIKEHIYWNLESDLFKSKYGTEKILNYYLFGTTEVLKNPKNMYYYKGAISLSDAKDTVYFDLEAAYKTGKEGYFENNAYKERDVFSKREYVPNPKSPIVSYAIPESVIMKHKYEVLVESSNGMYEGLYSANAIVSKLSSELRAVKDIKANIPVVGFVSTFPEVARAMELLTIQKDREIKAETDHSKAIKLVETWNQDYKFLLVLEKSETSTLKALNKKMKGITDEKVLMEMFRNYSGK